MIKQLKKIWLEGFFVALPFLPAWPFGVPWARFFISGAGVVWLVKSLMKKNIMLPISPPVSALFAFILFATLSLLWTPALFGGLRKALVLWSIAPLLLIVNSHIARRRLLAAFAIGSAISALAGFLLWTAQFIVGTQIVTDVVTKLNPFLLGQSAADTVAAYPSWYVEVQGRALLRSFFPFPDPHTAALFWGMGLAVALVAANSKFETIDSKPEFQKRSLVIGRWLLVIILTAALMTTFSRGAYVVLLGLGVFIFLRAKRAYLLLLLAMLVLLFFAVPLVSQRFFSLGNLAEGSIAGRLELWRTAWSTFMAHPLFGAGLGGFSYAADPGAQARDPVNAHSTYLEIAAETGVFGVLFFVAAILLGLLAAWRKGAGAFGVAAGIFVFAIHAIFEIDLYSPPNLAALFLLLSLVGSQTHIEQRIHVK